MRSYFFAPTFWLVNVTVACEKLFMAMYTKPSRLLAAEQPAIT